MEKKVRILGIDPGLQVCGYAAIDTVDEKVNLIEAGVLKTENKAPLEYRLNQIAGDIKLILDKFSPDIIAIEELYSHYEHPKTAILMGHARGVILQKAAESAIKVNSFNATKIKKSITGNGRASKEQVQRTIQTLLSLAKLPEPNDVADAIAAAICCADSIRTNIAI